MAHSGDCYIWLGSIIIDPSSRSEQQQGQGAELAHSGAKKISCYLPGLYVDITEVQSLSVLVDELFPGQPVFGES